MGGGLERGMSGQRVCGEGIGVGWGWDGEEEGEHNPNPRKHTKRSLWCHSCCHCFATLSVMSTHLQQGAVPAMAGTEVSGRALGCGAVAAEHAVRRPGVKQGHKLLPLGRAAAAAAGDAGRKVVGKGHQAVQPLPLGVKAGSCRNDAGRDVLGLVAP